VQKGYLCAKFELNNITEEMFMINHKGTQKIKTERLILRRFKITDAKFMFNNWASDPEVTKYLSWPSHKELSTTKKIINLLSCIMNLN
jgi:RimJ/RimL family protein N-acetyltransferase